MAKELLALITCPEDKSENLAGALVEAKVAACVNIINDITSVYQWQGKVEKDKESLLLAKTNASTWKVFESKVTELHPYDVPEIISFEIEKGSSAYLEWLNKCLSGAS